jgi:hypothetical protein
MTVAALGACRASASNALDAGRQLADAGPTDGAPPMFLERVLASTEDAGRARPREDDRVAAHGDLDPILLDQPEAPPDIARDDDAAEVVDPANDPRPDGVLGPVDAGGHHVAATVPAFPVSNPAARARAREGARKIEP